MQYTLDLLWQADELAIDRTLNTETYHRLGGVEGALRLRAEALYNYADVHKTKPRPESQQQAMRRIFLRLIDLAGPERDAPPISKRAWLSEFDREMDQQLITELIDEKLLTSNSVGGGTVEIAHEALLSAWPTLKGWIEQGRDVLYVHNRLRADAPRGKRPRPTTPRARRQSCGAVLA